MTPPQGRKLTGPQRKLLQRLAERPDCDRIACKLGTPLSVTAYTLARRDLLEKCGMFDGGLIYTITDAGRAYLSKEND